MKMEIAYSCGHTDVVQVYGKASEREYKLARMAESVCPDCKAARAKIAAEKSAEQADADGLPRLVGSDKQIAWADDIRRKFIADTDELRGQLSKAATENPELYRDRFDAWNAAVDRIKAQTKAAWWIDNNHVPAARLVKAEMNK